MATQPIRPDIEATSSSLLSFEEATRVRRSIRGFLDTPVSTSVIREVLQAQYGLDPRVMR